MAKVEEEERAAIVECVHCGTAGYVKFKGEQLTSIHMVCKCPRMSVEEANKHARKKAQANG
jgi:hypothetical protein